MDRKTTNIIAYLTLVGFIVAILAGNKEESKFHINQALVIVLFTLLTAIPVIGWIWSIFMAICWFIGIIGAINDKENPIPLLGSIKIIQ